MKTVIEMAREVETEVGGFKWCVNFIELERFAELVRAEAIRENSAEYRMGWNDGQVAEREALIEIVDMHGGSIEIVAAIRARSNT